MDKVIYALRDVTATVSSIPLIASSIMSKKIASGADKILIDVKYGNGALLKTKEEARELSKLMIKIGEVYGREVRTILSDMNTPLGKYIGNSLEVLEAIEVLKGKEDSNNLFDLCVELASEMVSMGKEIDVDEAKKLVIDSIDSGKAFKKFEELVKYQEGDLKKIEVSKNTTKIRSTKTGEIKKINALELGKLSLSLGAGKIKKTDKIDYTVGIELNKMVGDTVKEGEVLMTLYTKKEAPDVNIDNIFTID